MSTQLQFIRAMPVLDCAEMARSLAYYCDRLGFHADTFGEPPTFAILQRGGVTLALNQVATPAVNKTWAAYLYVQDVDAVYAEFKGLDVTMGEPPEDRPYNCRDFTLDDPDGNLIGVGQILVANGFPPGLSANQGRDAEGHDAAGETTGKTTTWTGGCQCGAVRFRVGTLGRATVCHCRMCQKATSGIAGVFVVGSDIVWTRGAPKYFRSSNKVKRGFCGDCGTPLTFEMDTGGIDMSIAAFDRAAEIAPVLQLSSEARLPWADTLPRLPERTPEEMQRVHAHYQGIISYQHPDHDTAQWRLSKQTS